MIGSKKQAINYLLNYTDDNKFEVKEYKPKRGLKANAYYWALINQLATVLRMSKEDLHFKMLQDWTDGTLIAISPRVEPSNYFKYYVDNGEATINGAKVRKLRVYKQSSEMNTKEFSILLDGLIQECKQQDIETLEDKEIKEMIHDYEIYYSKR